MGRRSKYSETQVITILKKIAGSLSVADASRAHGVNQQTIHRWKSKYGGFEPAQLKQMKAPEEANRRIMA